MQPTHPKRISTRTKAALWVMIGPTALLILTFAFYAVFNLVAANDGPSLTTGCAQTVESDVNDGSGVTRAEADEDCANQLFGRTSSTSTIVNVITYITGVIGFITWLPGLVIGIVLLATRPKVA